ncbi:MAG: hypothetical protein ACFFCL_10085 [Promethearchaeota archaeon]
MEKIRRGGLICLIVGLVILLYGVWFGTITNWRILSWVGAGGWLYPIIGGISLMIFGLVGLVVSTLHNEVIKISIAGLAGGIIAIVVGIYFIGLLGILSIVIIMMGCCIFFYTIYKVNSIKSEGT